MIVSDRYCAALYYHHRFIIQRDKIEQQSNTSYVTESNSSNCIFQEALIALAISLLNGICFSYPKKREFFAVFCFRSICWQMFFKISVLKNFTNFTRKHLCWSLILIKLQAWFAVTSLKRLKHRCFLVKFAKFLRTHFFIEHLQWLLLRFSDRPMLCELNWYVETTAQVISCEFWKIFKNIIDHLWWLLLSVTRC